MLALSLCGNNQDFSSRGEVGFPFSTMIPGSRHKYLYDHRRSRSGLHKGDGETVDAGPGKDQGSAGQCGSGKAGAANRSRSAKTASGIRTQGQSLSGSGSDYDIAKELDKCHKFLVSVAQVGV